MPESCPFFFFVVLCLRTLLVVTLFCLLAGSVGKDSDLDFVSDSVSELSGCSVIASVLGFVVVSVDGSSGQL